jgi:diguanylate cyclase (GGDEF)-like protein/PAS domain S-box-containing protein
LVALADRPPVDVSDDILALEHQRPRTRKGEPVAAARGAAELNRAVIAALEEGVIVLDAAGVAISANESACRILGLPSSAILGRTPPYVGDAQVFLEDGRRADARTSGALAALREGVAQQGVLMRRVDESGERWESANFHPLVRPGDEVPYGLVYSLSDVTERKRSDRKLRAERDRAQRYLDLAGTVIVVLDTEGRVAVLNRAGHDLMGYAEGELVGADWFARCVPADNREARRTFFERFLADEVSEEETSVEAELLTRRGDARLVSWNHTILHDEHGRVSGTLSSGVDITDRRAAERQVSYLAYHDGLTGLPNRALLEDHLTRALARSRRSDCAIGLLYIDLDGFKLVNDSLGHASGDEVLREAAERLAMTTRASDLLARQGGDEFLLLLGDLDSDRDPQEVAIKASDRILQALAEPFHVAGAEFQLGASIGIALYPRDAHDRDGLLKAADGAMYGAKRAGRGVYAFPEADSGDARARLSLTTRLRRALARDELELYFQPVFTVEDNELVGAEALLRWNDPHEGMIAPAQFVPVAEETGLINALGDWVLEALCRHAAQWRDMGLATRLSFNLSPRQLRAGDVAERISSCVAEHGLEPSNFCVEVTESTAMAEHARVEPQLRHLHDAGFILAIDDFGSGHSSLARLRELPVDMLKVDRSFMAATPHDAQASAIVGAVLALANGLGMTTVAEGVETEAQHDFLRDAGCPLAQGFHLGRPVPFAEMTALLESRAQR